MTKPNLERDEDLARYRARRQVFALQAGSNLNILLEDGSAAVPAGRELIQLAEAREFEAWMQELLEWKFTSTQHRARAAELRERAAHLDWDQQQEVWRSGRITSWQRRSSMAT